MKKRRHYIAIDVDGVLSNQIKDILPILKNKYGTELEYNEVTDWNLPIKDTDIAKIIVKEQSRKSYIMRMPLMTNSSKIISMLYKKNYIAIATARPEKSDKWTKKWLKNNNIPYDEYFNLREGEKQNADLDFDILIDDYIKNIYNYLNETEGKAILFAQPWNSDRNFLQTYIDEKRLKIAKTWDDIPKLINELLHTSK